MYIRIYVYTYMCMYVYMYLHMCDYVRFALGPCSLGADVIQEMHEIVSDASSHAESRTDSCNISACVFSGSNEASREM